MSAYDLETVIARFQQALASAVSELEDAGLTIGDLCVAIRSMERELSTGVVPPFDDSTSEENHPQHPV